MQFGELSLWSPSIIVRFVLFFPHEVFKLSLPVKKIKNLIYKCVPCGKEICQIRQFTVLCWGLPDISILEMTPVYREQGNGIDALWHNSQHFRKGSFLEVDMAHSIGNKGEFNEGPFQGSLSEFKENTKQRGSTQALVTMQLSTLVLKGP